MRLQPPDTAPERIGFLLLPRFAMVAFFSAIEPLRIANRIGGQTLFEWRTNVSGKRCREASALTLRNRLPGSP